MAVNNASPKRGKVVDIPSDIPTIGTATGGAQSASVTFTAPTATGRGGPVTGYKVTSIPDGVKATGTSSPIAISGLTAGTSYTFTVAQYNVTGSGEPSAASNAVTPYIAAAYIGARTPSGRITPDDGTISYVNGQFVALGYVLSGTTGLNQTPCFTSTDGATWTLKTADTTIRPKNVKTKIVYTNAGYYVTLSSTTGSIMYSTDLITWTEKNLSATAIKDIETDGTNIATINSSSFLIYNTTGNPSGTWTTASNDVGGGNFLDYWGGNWYVTGDSVTTIRRASSVTSAFSTVFTQSSGNGFRGGIKANSKASPTVFVTGENTTGNAMYSTNGTSWSTTSGTNLWGYGFPINVDLSTGYFYSTNTDLNSVMYSTNGSSWTNVDPGISGYAYQVIAGGGYAIYPGSGGLGRSTNNGSTWTALNKQYGGTGLPRGIAYGGGKWVVNVAQSSYPTGTASTNRCKIAYSTDLSTWTQVSLESTTPGTNLTSMSYANGKFWTYGAGSCLLSSSDAVTWAKSTGTISGTVYRVVGDGSSTLVAPTGGSNVYYYSTNNGSSWTTGAWTSSYPMYSAAYGNGKFVAVGFDGVGTAKIAYGTSGSSWTYISAPAGTDNVLTGVTWSSGANLFLATMNASGNKYLTSPDGITWTVRTCPTNMYFYNQSGHVLGDSLGFVVSLGTITNYGLGSWRSTDGINWTSFSTSGFSGATPGMTNEAPFTALQMESIASNGTTRVFASNGPEGLLSLT